MSLNNLSLLILLCLLMSGCIKQPEQDNEQTSNPLKQLTTNDEQYALPSTENRIGFPQAHQPKKAYRHEWWYLTANLTTESGQEFASQWTLFRTAINNQHWYFAHAALADSHNHQSAFRNGRQAIGNVIINEQPFEATIDDWSWQSSGSLLPAQLRYGSTPYLIKATPNDHEVWQAKLSLASDTPFFLQGENGFSKKHQQLDIASHYYSQPFIEVSGEIFWQGQWQKATGNAWFDREWGSKLLAQDQHGWDWFSLRLSAEKALMIYQIRSDKSDFVYGSIMHSNGSIETLDKEDIHINAINDSNSKYPQTFQLTVAKDEIELTIHVVNKNQIMRFGIEYFEGMVTFTGSHQGQGFVEMTGYND